MGFPLPENPDVDDLLWVLVAIPNAIEFRRAAIGHLGELGKGQNWGEDAVTDASFVAAQSWLRAMQETYRLLDMGWPDLVLGYIDDIETLLQAMQGSGSVGCCPEGTTYYPPVDFDFDSVPQPIVDAGFAASTSDLEGYADYRCMAGHMLLSNIQDKLDKLGPIILGGFALFNIVAGLLGGVLILGGGGATLVVAGLAVDIMAVLGVISALDDVTAEMVTGWADTLEGDRDTIVCAMQGADGAAAVKAALVGAVTDSIGAVGGTLVSFFNLEHLINAWWYGENNAVDLAQQMADAGHDPSAWTCTCEEPYPSGYDLIPFADLSPSCSQQCSYVSMAGNVVTMTTTPADTMVVYTMSPQANVVGLVIRTTRGGGTGNLRTAATNGCNGAHTFNQEVVIGTLGGGGVYNMYMDPAQSAARAAWSDWRDFYGVLLSDVGPCTNSQGFTLRPRDGSWAGTYEAWWIVTV